MYLALSFAYGCRQFKQLGKTFHSATAIQTFFWWFIAVGFGFSELNKLHIIWLLPLAYFFARYLSLASLPFVRPVIFTLTEIFMKLVLLGANSPDEIVAKVAQTQLHCFYSFKRAYPNLLSKDLYYEVLTKRPGCDREKADAIISKAAEVNNRTTDKIRFWMVVLELIISDFRQYGAILTVGDIDRLEVVVKQIIPDEL